MLRTWGRFKNARQAAIVVAVLFAGLLLAPTSPARAGVPETQFAPITLDDIQGPQQAISQLDGGVTVGCGSGNSSAALKTFSSTGALTQSRPVSDPYLNLCPGNSAVGADGTVFVAVYADSGYTRQVQAIQNGTTMWTYTIPCGGDINDIAPGP